MYYFLDVRAEFGLLLWTPNSDLIYLGCNLSKITLWVPLSLRFIRLHSHLPFFGPAQAG